ncbi:zinc-ribbon and DUF3426 domain-containing protein [Limnohabitans sp. 15K]|uniref:zinc-ribbon and DUF3426 domain-containing protein n=1 Tax=Limnohabitans sp. 15K TaxID=1100706 RepID=UPI000C1E84FE|nr:zinc-ribbon and DUF3426 domain-containing protein [Limnohabitans sp. 15K]PIT83052.1 hypothetical protein B9Z40_05070 [Limnohabitans sp. 15K]
MTWITRCPVCAVTYRVVPDQLKVAQGWLRCGQCQEVFDSKGLVVDWPLESHKTEPIAEPEVPADRLDIDDFLKQEDKSALQTPVSAFEEALSTFKPLPLMPTTTAAAPEVFGVPLGALIAHDQVPEDQAPALPPSAPPWWPKVLVLSLVLMLALQWMVAGRYLLVAAEPALAQPLQIFCRLMGCEMEPPPVRNGVVIESSSMTPQEGGLLLLWSVRNVTTQALEMPALELTWLDAQDKSLVRRVLRPTEQAAPSALAAGQIWSGQLQLLPAEGLQPLGYRLVSFYP